MVELIQLARKKNLTLAEVEAKLEEITSQPAAAQTVGEAEEEQEKLGLLLALKARF